MFVSKWSRLTKRLKMKKRTKTKKRSRLRIRVVGPVTIWIGVFSESTSATAAHDAAQDVLALLKDYQITDVDIDKIHDRITRYRG